MINGKYYKRVFATPKMYKNILFKSTLERDFAMYLDSRNIKCTYEGFEFELIPQEEWTDKTEIDKTVKKIKRNKTHTLRRTVYTPDFVLPELNLIVETKGYQFDDGLFRLRFRLFQHKYPTYAIWVVRHHNDFDKLDAVIEALKIASNKE